MIKQEIHFLLYKKSLEQLKNLKKWPRPQFRPNPAREKVARPLAFPTHPPREVALAGLRSQANVLMYRGWGGGGGGGASCKPTLSMGGGRPTHSPVVGEGAQLVCWMSAITALYIPPPTIFNNIMQWVRTWFTLLRGAGRDCDWLEGEGEYWYPEPPVKLTVKQLLGQGVAEYYNDCSVLHS